MRTAGGTAAQLETVVFSPQALIMLYVTAALGTSLTARRRCARCLSCALQLVPYLYAAFYRYTRRAIAAHSGRWSATIPMIQHL